MKINYYIYINLKIYSNFINSTTLLRNSNTFILFKLKNFPNLLLNKNIFIIFKLLITFKDNEYITYNKFIKINISNLFIFQNYLLSLL